MIDAKPTAVNPGEVIFVQVKDEWKGEYLNTVAATKDATETITAKDGTITTHTYCDNNIVKTDVTTTEGTTTTYTQYSKGVYVRNAGRTKGTALEMVQYGIKSIDKVTTSTKVPTGHIYTIDATANRFFFAVCRDNTKRAVKANQTFKEYLTSKGGVDGTTDLMTWYDEWSYYSNQDGNAQGYDAITGSYDILKTGKIFPAGHNCTHSLENNHIISYFDNGVKDVRTHKIYFYLPENIEYKPGTTSNLATNSPVPFVFFYQVDPVSATTQVNAANKNGYEGVVTWETTFDKSGVGYEALESTTFNGTTAAEGTAQAGLREVFTIERSIDGGKTWTQVKAIWDDKEGAWVTSDAAGASTELYNDVKGENKFIDKDMPSKTTEGFTVQYKVTSKLVEIDEKGDINAIAIDTQAKTVSVDVAGEQQALFISLSGSVKATYHWGQNDKKEEENIDTYVNNFTGGVTEYGSTAISPEEGTGDIKFILTRGGKEETVLNQPWTYEKGDYTYTPVGGTEAKTFKSITDLINDVLNNQTDEITIDCAEKDGKSLGTYKVEVHDSNNIGWISNSIDFVAPVIVPSVSRMHRSGVVNGTQSFTNEISFTPADAQVYDFYTIYRDTEAIARVTNDYRVLVKDDKGNYQVVSTLPTPADGKPVTFADVFEMPAGSSMEFRYTVSMHTVDGNNEYGSPIRSCKYDGKDDELLLSLSNSGNKESFETNASSSLVKVTATVSIASLSHNSTNGGVNSDAVDGKAEVKYSDYVMYAYTDKNSKPVPVTLTPNGDGTYTVEVFMSKADLGLDSKADGNETSTSPVYLTLTGNVEGYDGTEESGLSQKTSNVLTINPGKTVYTGVEGVEGDVTVNVYPNPASDYAVVEGAEGLVEIYSASGAKVAEAASAGMVEFDLSNLAKGLYIVKTSTSATRLIVK